MKQFYAADCVSLARDVGRLSEHLNNNEPDLFRIDNFNDSDKAAIASWRESFSDMGLQMCVLQCDRMLEKFGGPYTNSHLATMLEELFNRLYDEASSSHCIILNTQETAIFLQASPLFGPEVANNFPEMSEDVAETGKCLALRRSTAAVFHLMRIMESGVQRLGTKLGVSLANEPVWQVILDQVNAKIKLKGKTAEAKKLAGVAGNLYNVKLAWRNETMHPKATYTDEEADNVFRAVRAFVQELATVL